MVLQILKQPFDFTFKKYNDEKMLLNIIYAANNANKPDDENTAMEEPYTHIIVVDVGASAYGCANKIKSAVHVTWTGDNNKEKFNKGKYTAWYYE
jgi:hypothetical protein